MDSFVEPPADAPGELLAAFLDAYRAAILRKLDGLTDEQLDHSPLPSRWTPLELLWHLTCAERRWLRWGFLGEPLDDPWADADPVTDRWRVPDGMSAEQVRAAYLAGCERAREIVAAAALTDRSARGGRFTGPEPPPTLQWILLHLLQEYARHLGHLDVVRELTDGQVGE